MARCWDTRGLEQAAQLVLALCRTRRRGRIVRQAEAGGRGGGHDSGVVVGRDHGVEGVPGREGRDLVGGPLRVAQIERHAACRLEVLERLFLVRPDDGLGAEARGGLDEIVGAVGRCREQEKDAAHILSSIGR